VSEDIRLHSVHKPNVGNMNSVEICNSVFFSTFQIDVMLKSFFIHYCKGDNSIIAKYSYDK